MYRLHFAWRLAGRPTGREDLDTAGERLLAPPADLVGVLLKALRELDDGGIAVQRGECDLGLGGGGVIPTWSTGNEGSGDVSE